MPANSLCARCTACSARRGAVEDIVTRRGYQLSAPSLLDPTRSALTILLALAALLSLVCVARQACRARRGDSRARRGNYRATENIEVLAVLSLLVASRLIALGVLVRGQEGLLRATFTDPSFEPMSRSMSRSYGVLAVLLANPTGSLSLSSRSISIPSPASGQILVFTALSLAGFTLAFSLGRRFGQRCSMVSRSSVLFCLVIVLASQCLSCLLSSQSVFMPNSCSLLTSLIAARCPATLALRASRLVSPRLIAALLLLGVCVRPAVAIAVADAEPHLVVCSSNGTACSGAPDLLPLASGADLECSDQTSTVEGVPLFVARWLAFLATAFPSPQRCAFVARVIQVAPQPTAIIAPAPPSPLTIVTSVEGFDLHLSSRSPTGYEGVSFCPAQRGRKQYHARLRGKLIGYYPTAVVAAVHYARRIAATNLRSSSVTRSDLSTEAILPSGETLQLQLATDSSTGYRGVDHLPSRSVTKPFRARLGPSTADFVGYYDSALGAATVYALALRERDALAQSWVRSDCLALHSLSDLAT